jgi:CubicO group peptidase (beta-lactamase class C family)
MLDRQRGRAQGIAAARVMPLAFLLLGAGAAAATPDNLQSRVAALVEEAREQAGIPALAVAVVTDREVVVELASGLADREAGTPATTDTVFPAASVSKLLTAALVMQQVERGRLALDTPANQYLEPELRIRDADGAEVPATVRQLLNHTSGPSGGLEWHPLRP